MSDKAIQIGEIALRVLTTLGGLAVCIFGHDWATGATIIAGGNSAASVAAKSMQIKK